MKAPSTKISWRIGVVGEPPPEEGRRLVDRPAEQLEPGPAELRLEGEPPSRPFRRRPHEGEHDGADEEDLAPEDLGRVHGDEDQAACEGGRKSEVARGGEPEMVACKWDGAEAGSGPVPDRVANQLAHVKSPTATCVTLGGILIIAGGVTITFWRT